MRRLSFSKVAETAERRSLLCFTGGVSCSAIATLPPPLLPPSSLSLVSFFSPFFLFRSVLCFLLYTFFYLSILIIVVIILLFSGHFLSLFLSIYSFLLSLLSLISLTFIFSFLSLPLLMTSSSDPKLKGYSVAYQRHCLISL